MESPSQRIRWPATVYHPGADDGSDDVCYSYAVASDIPPTEASTRSGGVLNGWIFQAGRRVKSSVRAHCTEGCAEYDFVRLFAQKRLDLHRNKGLVLLRICAMILSTEERSSRRREWSAAVRNSGNAVQGAHGKPGVPESTRATGGSRKAAKKLTRKLG